MAKNNNPSYEEVFWKVESKDIQIHGIDKPKIVSAIEIEGVSSGGGEGKAFTKSFQFNAADHPVWSVMTFDWFWFTPKKVMIQGRGAVGLWYFNSDWVKVDQTTTPTGESGRLIFLEDWAALFLASLLEFTNDGFTVTVRDQTDDFFFFYATCFSNI